MRVGFGMFSRLLPPLSSVLARFRLFRGFIVACDECSSLSFSLYLLYIIFPLSGTSPSPTLPLIYAAAPPSVYHVPLPIQHHQQGQALPPTQPTERTRPTRPCTSSRPLRLQPVSGRLPPPPRATFSNSRPYTRGLSDNKNTAARFRAKLHTLPFTPLQTWRRGWLGRENKGAIIGSRATPRVQGFLLEV